MSLYPEPVFEASEADRRRLLTLARRAVEVAARERRRVALVMEESEFLQRPAASFVSLHKGALLRGCIGQVVARHPLHRAVVEAAYSAALEDPRFAPVAPEELEEISLEISVLSPLFPVTPEQIRVGIHGLLVSLGGVRGLLLPQVATTYRWDAQQFLEETCLKAGLDPQAWKSGAQIHAFTAEVFAEVERRYSSSMSSPA